jgi:hypothetical protein
MSHLLYVDPLHQQQSLVDHHQMGNSQQKRASGVKTLSVTAEDLIRDRIRRDVRDVDQLSDDILDVIVAYCHIDCIIVCGGARGRVSSGTGASTANLKAVDNVTATSDCWIYAGDSWYQFPSLAVPLYRPKLAITNNMLMVVGGGRDTRDQSRQQPTVSMISLRNFVANPSALLTAASQVTAYHLSPKDAPKPTLPNPWLSQPKWPVTMEHKDGRSNPDGTVTIHATATLADGSVSVIGLQLGDLIHVSFAQETPDGQGAWTPLPSGPRIPRDAFNMVSIPGNAGAAVVGAGTVLSPVSPRASTVSLSSVGVPSPSPSSASPVLSSVLHSSSASYAPSSPVLSSASPLSMATVSSPRRVGRVTSIVERERERGETLTDLLVLGGFQRNDPCAPLDRFHGGTTSTWSTTTAAPWPNPRWDARAVVIGNHDKIALVGGRHGDGKGVVTYIDILDIKTLTWDKWDVGLPDVACRSMSDMAFVYANRKVSVPCMGIQLHVAHSLIHVIVICISFIVMVDWR